MSLGRVTSTQLYTNAQTSMSQLRSRLSTVQSQASTGLAIQKPSDDPAGTAQVLRLRSDIAANTQYGTNISDGLSWLATADSALSRSTDLVRQASDLTIQASNSATSSPTTREAIAVQLEGLKADLLAQANTKYLGRSVFAGTSDAATAFTPAGAYQGVTTADGGAVPVQRRISASESITVSADGGAAFGTPGAGATDGTSVFQAIDRVVSALRSGTYGTDTSSTGPQATVTAGIDALQTSLSRLSSQQAVVGSDYSRVETAKARNLDAATTLEKQRSSVQDVDTTAVLLNLKTQEVAYQTALSVTARVLQPTLMSFLQ